MSSKPGSLREELSASIDQLVKAGLEVARTKLGSDVPPYHQVNVSVMVARPDQGVHDGKQMAFNEPDLARLSSAIEEMKVSQTWTETRKVLQTYIDSNHILTAGMILIHDLDHLLWSAIEAYILEANSLSYDPAVSKRVIAALVSQLDSPTVEFHSLLVLRGFKATHEFKLGPKITIRPIRPEDLRVIGDPQLRESLLADLGGMNWPFTDSWVAEFRIDNVRGTTTEINRVHERHEILLLALRAFKEGGVWFRHGFTKPVTRFEHTGMSYGNEDTQLSIRHQTYDLSETEIPVFVAFWERFHALMSKERHYLHIPIRRLRAGGARGDHGDALVDYVIGLEALLGTSDERTELGYRFRVRGSVVLAPKRAQRRSIMQTLGKVYDLRSKVVHGEFVQPSDLESLLPFAENALREVWRWYFEGWPQATSNRPGVSKIDEELVGAE